MLEQESSKYWSLPPEVVLDLIQSNTNGLTIEEAALRLKRYGENTLKTKKKILHWLRF